MRKKDSLLLLCVFLLYGFLLTPLGDYKHPKAHLDSFYAVQSIDPADDTGYYAYARSGVIDGDFDFFNEKRYYYFDAITPA